MVYFDPVGYLVPGYTRKIYICNLSFDYLPYFHLFSLCVNKNLILSYLKSCNENLQVGQTKEMQHCAQHCSAQCARCVSSSNWEDLLKKNPNPNPTQKFVGLPSLLYMMDKIDR